MKYPIEVQKKVATSSFPQSGKRVQKTAVLKHNFVLTAQKIAPGSRRAHPEQ
jgi:hypothetical protein